LQIENWMIVWGRGENSRSYQERKIHNQLCEKLICAEVNCLVNWMRCPFCLRDWNALFNGRMSVEADSVCKSFRWLNKVIKGWGWSNIEIGRKILSAGDSSAESWKRKLIWRSLFEWSPNWW
jgi:hypothetical protein